MTIGRLANNECLCSEVQLILTEPRNTKKESLPGCVPILWRDAKSRFKNYR